MNWEFIVCGIIFIAVGVIVKRMNANHSYTAGKHMFKMSDGNLEDDKELDFTDQKYYDNKNILK